MLRVSERAKKPRVYRLQPWHSSWKRTCMGIQSKSRSRLRTFMPHSSLQPLCNRAAFRAPATVCVCEGRRFFSKRIWDESQTCQIMISLYFQHPYHNTGLSSSIRALLEPLLPQPAAAWWEVRSERHFVKGSRHPCEAVEYGKNTAILPKAYFYRPHVEMGDKKNFSRQNWHFPKGDDKIR